MENSIDKRGVNAESENTDITNVDTAAHADLRLSGKHDALLPISIVGGLIGMLAGTLPAAIWTLIFGFTFSPMYLFLPLFICWGIKIFKGYSGRRGFIMIWIFSLIGFYLTILSCVAASYVIRYDVTFLSLPLITITLIGKGGILPGTAISSAYVFPLLFTIFGILLAHELMHQRPSAIPSEPDASIET